MESKLFPIKDGDIVQLGIDFRGGEEMIFRCVKIRIECNRSWQKRPNNFKWVFPTFLSRDSELAMVSNGQRTPPRIPDHLCMLLTCPSMHRHAQLQSLGRSESSTQENSGECAICLGSVLVSVQGL